MSERAANSTHPQNNLNRPRYSITEHALVELLTDLGDHYSTGVCPSHHLIQ